MKIIFSGLESSGKSLQLAIRAGQLVERNARWFKRTGKSRPIVSNMQFSSDFVSWASSLNVEVRYWKDLEDLITLAEADVICDEVGNYFDSRMWADLSLDVRRWLTQGAKTGIEFYGGAQDFAQVDVSFRRLISGSGNGLYLIDKIAGSSRPSNTKPKVRRIWGVCTMREIDPVGYDESTKKFANKGILPKFFFIRKDICKIFDTNLRIAKSKPPPFKHIERKCIIPGCRMERHVAREDGHYLVTHV